MAEPTTVRDLLTIGGRVLTDSTHIFDEHDNSQEARDLLAFVLGREEAALNDGEEIPRRSRERFLSLVARRAAGEPLPFLTGSIEFWDLDLKVKPGAFVPRPSSELTVEWASRRLKRIKNGAVVVDVCTGSGPIALALGHEFPDAEVWALDILAEGLAQGRANAKRLGIRNVRFKVSDMYEGLPRRLVGGVDVITGHVPYVPLGELEDLPAEVREHEPLDTLTDHSDDGLGLMERAVLEARRWLRKGGWLLLEMADDIAPKIEDMCREAGYDNVGIVSDDDELSVVVEGRSRG